MKIFQRWMERKGHVKIHPYLSLERRNEQGLAMGSPWIQNISNIPVISWMELTEILTDMPTSKSTR